MTYDTEHDIPTLTSAPVSPQRSILGDPSMTQSSLPDPFSDANGVAFFAGGDRRLLLDEVIHLCQFGNNLVAILGDQGVGTSSFLSQARYELAETAFCCFITADIAQTAETLFSQIVSQLELPVNPASTAGEMIATLRHSMSEGNMHRVVIVMDDAHHLGDQTLSVLASLLQGSQGNHLHLLLGGDKQLANRLDQFQLVDVLVYDITLNPRSAEETLDYLNFKMRSAGYPEADGWSREDAHAIWQESSGYPSEINSVAQTYLFRQDMGEEPVDDESAPGLPLVHMALLVVLLAALIMALFYLGDDDASAELAETNPQVTIDTSDTSDTSPMKPAEEKPLVEQPPAPIESVTAPPITVVMDGTAPVTTAEEPIAAAPATPVVDKAPQVETPQPASAAVEPAPVATQPLTPAPKPSSPPVAEPKVVVQRTYTADEKQVLTWPNESYSLQVMAAAQQQSLQTFVSQQPNRSDLRLVTVERNSQPWFIVLTGVYEDADAARRAIQALPQAQVNAGPWPRKVADIKREIEEFVGK